MEKKQHWIVKDTATTPWQDVGVAFICEDGSYNILLKKAMPADAKLQMRLPKPKADKPSATVAQ